MLLQKTTRNKKCIQPQGGGTHAQDSHKHTCVCCNCINPTADSGATHQQHGHIHVDNLIIQPLGSTQFFKVCPGELNVASVMLSKDLLQVTSLKSRTLKPLILFISWGPIRPGACIVYTTQVAQRSCSCTAEKCGCTISAAVVQQFTNFRESCSAVRVGSTC